MTDWAIIVGLNCWAMTKQAIKDLLAQTGVSVRVLYIDQGSDRETREAAERWSEKEPRLLCWFHHPCLPSLSATWNRAARFVWGQGTSTVLVVNNDVRLNPLTYTNLLCAQEREDAWFVSTVGVREADWAAVDWEGLKARWREPFQKGGPDFSCYLLTKAGHEAYPFDEGFIPAYCEDLDLHRRYMLGGDGDRIFSVNLPYLHYASQTLAGMEPDVRKKKLAAIGGSRRYYQEKWGGPVNQERYTIPFDATTDQDGVTTPELQTGATADHSTESLADA
jgi:hypothetical protein